jgi:hypothetical protein
VVVTGYGIPHLDLEPRRIEDKYQPMAAAHDTALVAVVELEGEAPARDTVGALQGGYEGDSARIVEHETKERGIAVVVGAEAAYETSVRDEAEPAVAYEGGAREGGRKREEAQEDLGE